MRFDFSKIDPLTGLPPVIEREEDKIQLMTRRPAKSGFIRLLQNRVNLRSVGNLHHSERLYYDVRTKSLYTARGGSKKSRLATLYPAVRPTSCRVDRRVKTGI